MLTKYTSEDNVRDEMNLLDWRQHRRDIDAFEQWSRNADTGDEEFAAVHVARIISKTHRIAPKAINASET